MRPHGGEDCCCARERLNLKTTLFSLHMVKMISASTTSNSEKGPILNTNCNKYTASKASCAQEMKYIVAGAASTVATSIAHFIIIAE